ncbi:hypothetical protein NA57DRAFT_74583 [Rhizodiscina lignyota]|uniref:Uncharacterized protein n=1 Tax=Rhizodiscina lignyota TaxID=1504668 RepID=A0A9P4IFV4_9PEZI|nr:hypothetical protein NA57DRAFT_74583 [Rhizodiscina lignyota]
MSMMQKGWKGKARAGAEGSSLKQAPAAGTVMAAGVHFAAISRWSRMLALVVTGGVVDSQCERDGREAAGGVRREARQGKVGLGHERQACQLVTTAGYQREPEECDELICTPLWGTTCKCAEHVLRSGSPAILRLGCLGSLAPLAKSIGVPDGLARTLPRVYNAPWYATALLRVLGAGTSSYVLGAYSCDPSSTGRSVAPYWP